jgi:biotin carboxylase
VSGADWFVLVESNTTGSGRLFCGNARRMGLRPVLLARDPDRYPYVEADGIESRRLDTTSLAAVREACANLPGVIAGVTSSSEYFIGISSEVARSLGRPHPDPAAIAVCRNKGRQRERLRDRGLPGPRFATAGTADEAVAAAAAMALPVVVKPVAGSGSVGVRRCADLDEVSAAAAMALAGELALASPPAVLIEEYLDGVEYSVETFDRTVIGITRKHLGPEPYFVEIGHDFPAVLEPGAAAAIGQAAVSALLALGLGWGGAHVELRTTAAGPRIVEVNPRLAGGMIPRMVQESTGIDMISCHVAKAAGLAELPRATRALAASIRFLVAPVAGRLAEVRGVPAAQQVPGVVEVGLTRAAGHDIVLQHSFQDRLGYVIASGADVAIAARAAEEGLRALQPRIDTIAGSEQDGGWT